MDRTVWTRWFLANAIGGSIGWAVAGLGTVLTFGIFTGALAGFLVNASLGIAQAGLLGSNVPPLIKPQYSGLWIIATIAGGFLGISALTSLLLFPPDDLNYILGDLFLRPLSIFPMLLIQSVAQWSFLRSSIRGAVWWIPGSLVSWGLGIAVGLSVAQLIPHESEAFFDIWLRVASIVSAGIVIVLIYSAGSGLVLMWLLRKSQPQVT